METLKLISEEIQDVEGINQELGGGLIGITEPIPGDKVLKEVSFFTGRIRGVDITYPGRGDTEEPLVGCVDHCELGYGAFGRAKIDKDPNSPTFGQVTGVVITSPGENYPAGDQDDVFVEEIEVQEGGQNNFIFCV